MNISAITEISNFFPLVSIIFGIVCLYIIYFISMNINSGNITNIERLPRNRILGAIFAFIDVIWCVNQALAIFSENYSILIYIIAGIILFLSCTLLDYLFARALAGFLILISHYFLYASFSVNPEFLALYSLAWYILGTFGILIGGFPYLLKDLLRKICNIKSLKYSAIIVSILYCSLCFIVGINNISAL